MGSVRDVCTLYLCGPIRLIGPDGVDHTPRSKRSRGLLALLGCSAGNKKPRRWLEQMLWSQRSTEQASASFRQVLVEIRKSLASHRHIIGSDRQNVWLDVACCNISYSSYNVGALAQSDTFAEGLSISDPAFSKWLSDIRKQFESSESNSGEQQLAQEAAAESDNSIYLFSTNAGNQDTSRVTEIVKHQIAFQLRHELDLQDRIPFPNEDVYLNRTRGIKLRTHSSIVSDKTAVSIELMDMQSGKVVWNEMVYSDAAPGDILNDQNIYKLTNTTSERIAKLMASPGKKDSYWIAAIVDKVMPEIFSFETARLLAATELLQKAITTRSHPLLAAWLAFAKMALYVEQIQTTGDNPLGQNDAIPDSSNLDNRTNSQILALLSFVELFMGENLDTATSLALDSVAANPQGALSTLSLANIQLRNGEYEKASESAEISANLTSKPQFRHWWYMTCCLARFAAGDYKGAIKYGEYTSALAPNFRPPLRHLYALYLERQDFENAKKTIVSLRKMEPQFSLQMIRDTDTYPAGILRRSPLIELNDISGLAQRAH